jgi:hypothetical protein
MSQRTSVTGTMRGSRMTQNASGVHSSARESALESSMPGVPSGIVSAVVTTLEDASTASQVCKFMY